MANKNITRVEKRYVPQQESYRNLPGLRPAAEPVVAAETPAVSGEGERLRQWGEALASGNKALKDFFTMEKSFEETNRAENRVRAQMELPPLEGQGLLDYGVAQGYNEGLGILKGQAAMVELRRRLAEANYGITPENLGSPDDVRAYVDNETQKIMQEFLPADANSAYLEGASKFLAQAKLEARVEGVNFWAAEEKRKRFDNYSAFVNNHFNTEIAPRMEENLRLGSPLDIKKIRGEISDLTRIGRDKFGFDRDTAAVVVLENFQDQLMMQYTQALSQDDSYSQMTDLEDMSDALMVAMDTPDADGVRLSNLRTPEVRKAVESLRATSEKFNGMAEGIRKKNQAKVLDDKMGTFGQRLARGEDFSVVHSDIKVAMATGDLDGAIGMSLLVDLGKIWDAGVFSRVPNEAMDTWRRQAVTGHLSHKGLLELSINNRFSKETYNELSGLISDYRADDNHRYTLSQRALAAAGDPESSRKQRNAAKQANTDSLLRITKELGITEKEKEYVEELMDQEFPDVYSPVPPDIMLASVKRYQKAYRRSLVTEQTDVAAAEAPGILTEEELKEKKSEISARSAIKKYPVGSSRYNEAQATLHRLTEVKRLRLEMSKSQSEGRSWKTTPVSPTIIPSSR